MSRVDNYKWKLIRWRRNPKCHWCGIETVLLKSDGIKLKEYPDNMATIDHLRSKYHPKRLEPNKPGEIRRVLACRKCNQLREQEETQRIREENPEELWRRSGSPPVYFIEKDRVKGYRPSILTAQFLKERKMS